MERFVREYLIDFNGSRAAIAVGYKEKTARTMASKLLARPAVQAMLGELAQEKLEDLNVTTDRILRETARIAFNDPRQFFDGEGNLIPIQKLSAAQAASISYIDHDELFQYFGKNERKKIGTTTKVKLSDKTKALDMLYRYKSLYHDKQTVTIQDDANQWDFGSLTEEELETLKALIEKSNPYNPDSKAVGKESTVST